MLRSVMLIVAFVFACTREPSSVPIAAHEPEGPAPTVSVAVTLQVVAKPRVDVGDDLGLEVRVRNGMKRPVTLVRPIYGSWELARHPRYELVWTDEHGEVVPDPLGFAPGLECGTLDEITRGDLVTVLPAETALLPNGPSARAQHVVLPSARPGRYRLQVRYLAQGIRGAEELQAVSEPVEVEIVGGDEPMWSCRAEQLAAAANHEWVTVSPAGLLEDKDGFWLVSSTYHHRVVDSEQQAHGEAWLHRLDGDLNPVGDPKMLIGADEEIGWVSVAEHSDGLLLVTSPGPVGGRRIEAWSVELVDGRPVAGEPKLVQASPGNPYVTRVAVRRDRVAVLHDGADADDDALMLSVLDRSSGSLGPARRVAKKATDFELLLTDKNELVAVWLERSDYEGGAMQHHDIESGEPLGKPVRFAFDPSHSLVGARFDRNALELAWAVTGGAPSTSMGIYTQRFAGDNGAARRTARALSPESTTEVRFGAVAWQGDRPGWAELLGDTLSFTFGSTVALSLDAGGTVKVESIADGFVVLWTDHRDDTKACAQLDDCVDEVYGARFVVDGSVRVPARRLTTFARPEPFVPSQFDWQKYCPTASASTR
jgi:hypothetical protein